MRYPYQDEFGEDYDIPAPILRLVEEGLLEDRSWHNDACPNFQATINAGTDEDSRTFLDLWVAEADAVTREFPDEARLQVYLVPDGEREHAVELLMIEDADEAARFIRKYLEKRI